MASKLIMMRADYYLLLRKQGKGLKVKNFPRYYLIVHDVLEPQS